MLISYFSISVVGKRQKQHGNAIATNTGPAPDSTAKPPVRPIPTARPAPPRAAARPELEPANLATSASRIESELSHPDPRGIASENIFSPAAPDGLHPANTRRGDQHGGGARQNLPGATAGQSRPSRHRHSQLPSGTGPRPHPARRRGRESAEGAHLRRVDGGLDPPGAARVGAKRTTGRWRRGSGAGREVGGGGG
ncbi:hypothetical protein PVAP13_2NG428100 [Panicum virgatum]|uniref:Uncharacterized protein n=1 Tax=Panicum virgatum TaxID=38727 RepID=A0A8T0VN78_PANVG|nr:hypothetical protein PVAP13_2NG428100 [Panicum virgatum]